MALYHSARGSVDYTIVGSPTIVDGVASGFSKNNYLSLGNFPQNVTDLEIQIKFKTGSASDVDVWQGLFSINHYESGHNMYIRYNRNTRQISFSPNFLYSNENFILYSNALEYETWYTYKISKVGNVYTLYKNGVAEDTATSTLAIEPNNLETRLGFVRIYTGSTVGGFNSSIDLKHTYITVNGQPWFGICPIEVKKHQIRGPVGYTVVGSPTITDGVVSGFSASDYLQINSQTIVPDTLEFGGRFTMGPNGEGGFLFHNFSVSNGIGLAVRPTSSSNQGMLLYAGTSHYVFYTHRFEAGTTHTYKVLYNKSAGICYLYVDDELRRTLDTSEYTVYFGDAFLIGRYGTDWFSGSIDLNETYIKVNGKLWFYQPQATKYIQRNNQLVWADPKLYLTGPVNYTVVGTPAIVDNVLTNITANDYLSIGTYSGDTPTSIEIGSSFKTSDTTVVANSVIGRLTGADTGIFWGNSSFPGRLCFKHRVSYDNGTTWTAVESKSAVLSLNKKYYVKFIVSLAEQKLTGYVSTDNINWTSYVANFNSGAILEGLTSIAIGKIFGHNASPLPIYLDYTYIKVNGKLWFYGKNYATQNIAPVPADYPLTVKGPVNYTIVGSPTITNGVASGFSSSNYLKTDTTFSQDVYNAWKQNSETVVKFRLNALQAQHIIYVPTGGTYAGFYMRGSQGKINWQIYSTSYRISPDFAFSANTDYWLKGAISNGVATFSYSTDGTNYTTLGTLDLQGITDPGSYTSYVQFGYGASDLGAVNGSIDLNETYIKVNGNPLFGKVYPVPSIGYVDMRTQVFTAAPEGAVVGRDE